jgi:hypothetical protein
MAARRCPVVLLCGLMLLAGARTAPAQEWHEAYRDGVRALAQGQPARAVSLLEYAVSRRPQPGRDVLTYGTNVERRYYPYLRLADAYLQLRDLAGARSALERSKTWGREPPEERRRLAAQVDDLATRLATPPPAAAATPVPTTPTPIATPVAATPAAPPPTVAASPAPTLTEGSHAGHAEPRVAAPSLPRASVATAPPRASAAPSTLAPATGGVEVVSHPPGASVYLDDELIGTTDPEWGRLVRSGLPAGRHRIRLARAGHQDVSEDVDVIAGGRIEFRRRLSADAAPAIDRRPLLFGAVALVLLGLTAWAVRRPAAPAAPAPARTPAFDNSISTPARPTPPGTGSPGVRRAADGLEYFGEYQLLGPLGRGGMASVYKAERRGEVSALKRPLPAFLEEPEFLERFLREAEIGRPLHHPNIVRILERGEVEGVPFFTMELVAGETLQARLQRAGPLDPRLATQVVVQVAEALDYAHNKGVVHRDLKPSNVMILPDGTAKVMDYGIARARRFEGLTTTGSFLGSPEYVAPEAIEGRGTDARSDLYSLGIVFYEVLAGRRPFVADTPFAVLHKHLTEVPPPPSGLRAAVPPELDRIVLRLLAKAADQRHASAEELVLDLRDFLNRA